MAEWCFKIGSLHSVKEKQQKKKKQKKITENVMYLQRK